MLKRALEEVSSEQLANKIINEDCYAKYLMNKYNIDEASVKVFQDEMIKLLKSK